MESLYDILKVDRNVDDEELKVAYRVLIRKLHPDKSGTDATSSEFDLVDKAWKILSDSEKRKKYDDWFREQSYRLQSVVLFDTLTIDDHPPPKGQTESGPFQFIECRCGGCYELERNDLDLTVNTFLVPCDNCSLFLKVDIARNKMTM